MRPLHTDVKDISASSMLHTHNLHLGEKNCIAAQKFFLRRREMNFDLGALKLAYLSSQLYDYFLLLFNPFLQTMDYLRRKLQLF